jgi:hypothetical protein
MPRFEHCQLFSLGWRDVSQRRVQPLTAVEAFDVREQLALHLVDVVGNAVFEELSLDRTFRGIRPRRCPNNFLCGSC